MPTLLSQRYQLILLKENLNACVPWYAKLASILQVAQHHFSVSQVDSKLHASCHLKLWNINKLQIQKLVCPELIIFYSHECQIGNLALT